MSLETLEALLFDGDSDVQDATRDVLAKIFASETIGPPLYVTLSKVLMIAIRHREGSRGSPETRTEAEGC